MRIWDITDKLYPDLQITEVHLNPPRIRAPRAAFIFLAVGLAVATTDGFATVGTCHASQLTVRLRNDVIAPSIGQKRPAARVKKTGYETDTQYGRSTGKLAEAFGKWFQPAPDSGDDGGFSFS